MTTSPIYASDLLIANLNLLTCSLRGKKKKVDLVVLLGNRYATKLVCKGYKGCRSEAVHFLFTPVDSSKKDVRLAPGPVQKCDR